MMLPMLRKKWGIVCGLICIVAIPVWHYLNRPPYEDMGTAYSLFTNHAFAELETYLERNHTRRWKHSPALYAAYLAEAQNQWEVAGSILSSTDWAAADQPPAHLLRLCHQYCSGTDQGNRIMGLDSSDALPPVLLGLQHYLRQEYLQAYSIWTQPSPRSLDTTDPWWQTLSAIHFSPLWLACHEAHCCVEMGNPEKAAQLLHSRLHLESKDHEPLEQAGIALLLWCWLDDPSLSVTERSQLIPYWARHTGSLKDFPEIRHGTAQRLLDEILACWSPESHAMEQQYSIDLLMILEQWNEENVLHHATSTLPYYLEAAGQEAFSFLALLQEHAPDSFFYRQVVDQLTQRLHIALQHYDFEPIPEIWQWLLTLHSPPQGPIEQALESLLEKAYETRTQQHDGVKIVEFYQQFFQSPEINERLANALLHASVQCWRKANQEEVARMLMEMALQITPHPLHVRNAIQSILTNLFVKAESNHLLDRMAMIYDCLIGLHLQIPEPLYERFDIANYLADADFLYEQERYQAARSHALCILKFHPDNQQACRMLGLCAYQLGNPIEAFEQLSRLRYPDSIVLEAIAWSQSLSEGNGFLTASCHGALP